MAPGRPSGSKNAPGHSAGGSRPNAGRKKIRADSPANPPQDSVVSSSSVAPAGELGHY